MKIELSETTFNRLQKIAVPLVDSVEDVIRRLLDAHEGGNGMPSTTSAPSFQPVSPTPTQAAIELASLRGFQRDLWELVISPMPFARFSLSDIKSRQTSLRTKHSHIEAFDESIRAALQKLRDKGLLQFLDRGHYRRLV